MRNNKLYMMYDDIAKTSVDIFSAATEEQAITRIENSLNKTIQIMPKLKYRVVLYQFVEYDTYNISDNKYCFKLIKTFKGGK